MPASRRRVGDRLTPVDPARPFTRRAGLASGLTDDILRGPRFRRLFQGVYVAADTAMTPVLMAQAARLVTPDGSFASHQTAAAILGAPVPPTSIVHLGCERRSRSRMRGIHLHSYAARPELWQASGVPLTAPSRTFVDLAGSLDLLDLVILGDALVEARRVDLAALRRAADAVGGGRAGRAAGDAAGFVRVGSQSPPETRLRMLLALAGLPEPQTQVPVVDPNGVLRYRFDLGWRSVKVAAEYDGRHHIVRAEQWRHDLRRREDVEDEGWRIVVVTWQDLVDTPDETLRRVTRALVGRGLRVPRLREDWRPHFPQRRQVS